MFSITKRGSTTPNLGSVLTSQFRRCPCDLPSIKDGVSSNDNSFSTDNSRLQLLLSIVPLFDKGVDNERKYQVVDKDHPDNVEEYEIEAIVPFLRDSFKAILALGPIIHNQ